MTVIDRALVHSPALVAAARRLAPSPRVAALALAAALGRLCGAARLDLDPALTVAREAYAAADEACQRLAS